MPARLSKFIIDASCKDCAHPWSDSCTSTAAGLGLHALQDSLRIYSTLYFIALLTKGKIPNKNELRQTLLNILQSTAFLSWSSFTYSMFICIIRRILGNFNVLTVSFLPSFLSSFAAIILEKPSRRTMLCLYVSNIATEVLFNMLVSRGYVSKIPRGEVYLFAMGISTLLYFFKTKKNSSDSIFKILRFAIGSCEENGYSQASTSTTKNTQSYDHNKISRLNIFQHSLNMYKQLVDKFKNKSINAICVHPHGCIYYVMIGTFRMFTFGFLAQVLLKVVFQMKNLILRPKLFKDIIFKRSNLNLAFFLGGFSGIYKLVSCLLRKVFYKDSSYFAIIAGILASTSFMIYPDNTIALYVLWKALQLLWNSGVEKGKVPEVKWFVIFLYCFSTAVLFHAAIVEPQNLRISYWKFLYNLSGGRIAMMSRIPIDEFGLSSNKQLHDILKKTNTHNNHKYSF